MLLNLHLRQPLLLRHFFNVFGSVFKWGFAKGETEIFREIRGRHKARFAGDYVDFQICANKQLFGSFKSVVYDVVVKTCVHMLLENTVDMIGVIFELLCY